jgi:hypothetical protein
VSNTPHICPRCRISKPFEAFYRDPTKSNGRRFICKACDLERSGAYYRSHREEKLAKVKAYQARARDSASR